MKIFVNSHRKILLSQTSNEAFSHINSHAVSDDGNGLGVNRMACQVFGSDVAAGTYNIKLYLSYDGNSKATMEPVN